MIGFIADLISAARTPKPLLDKVGLSISTSSTKKNPSPIIKHNNPTHQWVKREGMGTTDKALNIRPVIAARIGNTTKTLPFHIPWLPSILTLPPFQKTLTAARHPRTVTISVARLKWQDKITVRRGSENCWEERTLATNERTIEIDDMRIYILLGNFLR